MGGLWAIQYILIKEAFALYRRADIGTPSRHRHSSDSVRYGLAVFSGLADCKQVNYLPGWV